MAYNGLKWLPELYEKEEKYSLSDYIQNVYHLFYNDFLQNETHFKGCKIGMKKTPYKDGKEGTFWHIITKGQDEWNRSVDLERCKRIKWPKAVIVNHESSEVKLYIREIGGKKRIHLWLEKYDYVVVLQENLDKKENRSYYLLWTAFIIDNEHTRRKTSKHYKKYKKANAAT
jgi:hypothetical protein